MQGNKGLINIICRSVVALCLLALLSAAIAYWQLERYMDEPLAIDMPGMELQLPQGGNLYSLSRQLGQQNVLSSPRWLRIYNRLFVFDKSIKAGEYWLPSGISARQLLEKLHTGDVRYFQLTLVEGWTLVDVKEALSKQKKLIKKLPQGSITAQTLSIDTEHNSLEGLFFPDTYRYYSSTTDQELLQQAHKRLNKVLQQEWQQRASGLPYETPYEALIMASLIEKETGVAVERSVIAGVFVRRLKKGMRLQTDPTIIYGLGDSFAGNLRRSHLNDAGNLYNTYRHNGLTPTPIALAGREAIHAALHPAEGSALYFVAKGDGSHYFSSNLDEHRKAVQKYQITQRRKDYSSAPKK